MCCVDDKLVLAMFGLFAFLVLLLRPLGVMIRSCVYWFMLSFFLHVPLAFMVHQEVWS